MTDNKNNSAEDLKHWFLKLDPKWVVLNFIGFMIAALIGYAYYKTINEHVEQGSRVIAEAVQAHNVSTIEKDKEDKELREQLIRSLDENTRAINNLYGLWKTNPLR